MNHRLTAPVVWSAETRAAGGRRLRGLAAVFNSPGMPFEGFREVILPGAFRRALERHPDVILNFGHDSNRPLARTSAGNLRVHEETTGLAFEADLPNTTDADDLLELVRSGVIRESSFEFSYAAGGHRSERKNGELWTYVSEVERLFTINPVTEPAYAETSVEARSRGGRLRVREVSPYGPESKHSWFRDLLTATVDEIERPPGDPHRERRAELPRSLAQAQSHPLHGGAKEARERLAKVERRDVSSQSLDFVPQGAVPGFVSDLFAGVARSRAVVSSLIGQKPLPRALDLKAPRFKSGAAVVLQSGELVVVSASDVEAGAFVSPIVTLMGYVDGSQQVLDFGDGTVDEAIAQDLGAAYALALEQEVIGGSGTPGRLIGLLNVEGIETTSYADATPTAAENLAAIGSCYSDTASAYGGPIDTLVLHPRRRAFIEQKIGYVPRFPAPVVEAAAIPTNLGGGTEDAALFLASQEPVLATRPPTIEIFIEQMSDKLGVRIRAYAFAGLLSGRQPAAIGKVIGTGMVTPTF